METGEAWRWWQQTSAGVERERGARRLRRGEREREGMAQGLMVKVRDGKRDRRKREVRKLSGRLTTQPAEAGDLRCNHKTH